jgi:hypothetical protein
MMFRRHRVSILFGAVCAVQPIWSAAAQQIWFAPQASAVDFLDLFRPDSPWKRAASGIQVFKFYGNPFIAPASQEKINAIVSDLKRRDMAIAIETGIINVAGKPRPACGGWGYVEGYGPVALHALIAEKIKRAGGTIKYIAMDEPLWYGHYFKGKFGGQPGCQSNIDDVAKLAAQSLSAYVQAFPDVKIGDVEPSNLADVGLGRSPDWQGDLAAWAADFRAATGRPLAFLQIDVGWIQPAAPQHARMVYGYAKDLMQQHLIGDVGIIYNGNPNDASGAEWVRAAQDHMAIMERKYGLHPDQAVIQSWHSQPAHALPESAPDTLTGLVDYYLAQKRSR